MLCRLLAPRHLRAEIDRFLYICLLLDTCQSTVGSRRCFVLFCLDFPTCTVTSSMRKAACPSLSDLHASFPFLALPHWSGVPLPITLSGEWTGGAEAAASRPAPWAGLVIQCAGAALASWLLVRGASLLFPAG